MIRRLRLTQPVALSDYDRTTLLFFSTWLLVMISVPVLNWTAGESAMLFGIQLGVLAQVTTVVVILRKDWSWFEIGRIFALTAMYTLLIEAVGTATGLPFGDYDYTNKLQPQLAHVPLLIPLAWFMMLPVAWAIAEVLTRNNAVYFAVVAAAAITIWDLLLDPQMVNWQLWVWNQPGHYFGIPLLNYFGWFFTAFTLTLAARRWIRPFSLQTIRLLLTVYTVTWFLETFGLAFFWGLPAPALSGGVLMGALVLIAWRTHLGRGIEIRTL